jgi:hypothetical protein
VEIEMKKILTFLVLLLSLRVMALNIDNYEAFGDSLFPEKIGNTKRPENFKQEYSLFFKHCIESVKLAKKCKTHEELMNKYENFIKNLSKNEILDLCESYIEIKCNNPIYYDAQYRYQITTGKDLWVVPTSWIINIIREKYLEIDKEKWNRIFVPWSTIEIISDTLNVMKRELDPYTKRIFYSAKFKIKVIETFGYLRENKKFKQYTQFLIIGSSKREGFPKKGDVLFAHINPNEVDCFTGEKWNGFVCTPKVYHMKDGYISRDNPKYLLKELQQFYNIQKTENGYPLDYFREQAQNIILGVKASE